MSLFHLIMVLSPSTETVFLNVYAPVCMIVPFIFIVISNLGLILSFSLYLLYRAECEDRAAMKDENLGIYQARKLKALTITITLFICWVILTYSPAFTNQIYFL